MKKTPTDSVDPVDDPGDSPAPAAEPRALQAVTNDGPDEIHFNGRRWQRGQPQPVTAEEWAAMQARGAAPLGFNLTEEI